MNSENVSKHIESNYQDIFKPKEFVYEYQPESVGVLDDGRVQAKITCVNDWSGKKVSIITNSDKISVIPYHGSLLAKLDAEYENGDHVILLGAFLNNFLEGDENLYINGICEVLIAGVGPDFKIKQGD